MASRYNDKLELKVTTQPTRNAVGDLVAGSTSWQHLTMCREQPQGEGKERSTVGAHAIDYSSTIFFPANAPAVPLNSEIRVIDVGGTVLVQGLVKRYKRYRHYGKIWV